MRDTAPAPVAPPSSRPAAGTGDGSRPRRGGGRGLWWAVAAYLGIAAALFVVAGLSVAHLGYTGTDLVQERFPGRPWLNAWVHWDGRWYGDIAERGYWAYEPGVQGPVAFFPAYPLLMRLGGVLVGDPVRAGIAITVAAGATTAGLFLAWARRHLPAAAAWTALGLFLLYPFAYYLYGAVYADAVFLAAAIAAFLLAEHDRPLLAGLAGAVATAARPLGLVLVVALAVLVVQRRGGLRSVRWRDAGVLVAAAGVGAFALYCWARFGNPLAFVEAQRGWDQDPGPATWFKLQFFEDVRDFRSPLAWLVFVSHPVLTVGALALVPLVVRRLGWGYGIFVLLSVGLAAVSTKNFFGMSRYVLAAFPCFAVAGQWLAGRARLRFTTLAASGVTLVVATSFFARGHYLS
jgi:hypothetical protein